MTSYCSVADIKLAMPDVTWGSGYDATLTAIAERASRMIDLLTGREDNAYAATVGVRRYTALNSATVRTDEMADLPTRVEIWDGQWSDIANTDYYVEPINETPYNFLVLDTLNGAMSAFPSYPNAVRVTAKFGYSVTPPTPILQATLTQTVRWLKRGQHGYQDTGAVAELGQLMYVQALDPDVAAVLDNFRRLAL